MNTKKNQEDEALNFLGNAELYLQELGRNPFYADILHKAEPILKRWIYEVLRVTQPAQEESIIYLSRKEVCKLLKISLPTLSRYYKNGVIQGVRVGSRILFTHESIRDALKIIPNQKLRR
jgi:excisionase family DNA binding protein